MSAAIAFRQHYPFRYGVIERMTRQDPKARYQSVDEIIEDLAILRDE